MTVPHQNGTGLGFIEEVLLLPVVPPLVGVVVHLGPFKGVAPLNALCRRKCSLDNALQGKQNTVCRNRHEVVELLAGSGGKRVAREDAGSTIMQLIGKFTHDNSPFDKSREHRGQDLYTKTCTNLFVHDLI